MPANREIDESLEQAIEEALLKMDEEQRDHFKLVCGTLLAAYIDDDMHCLVILGKTDDEDEDKVGVAQIMAINTTEMHASQMVTGALNRVSALVMNDAPDRGMFH